VSRQGATRRRRLAEGRARVVNAALEEIEALAGDERVDVQTAERRRLAELGSEHAYPADVLREIGHELDLEESRMR
jgi:hypothetical protein